MKISSSKFYIFIISPVIFGFSYFLISSYLYGDQVVYRKLFEALSSAQLSEVLDLSRANVSGSEPISAILLWVGASLGFDKDIYISIFNTGLILGLFYFLRINRAPWYVIVLVLTNYYLLVLLTGAERLKFAYFFLMLAACSKGKHRIFFLAISPLAHFQSVILLAGIAAGYMSDVVRVFFDRWVIPKKYFYLGAIIALLSSFFVLFFGQNVFSKAAFYMRSSDGVSELFQALVLLVFSLLVSRDRLRILLALLPMIAAVFLLGGNRVNMIAFSVVFYFLVLERRSSSWAFLVLLSYLSYKSIGFYRNLVVYGDAFYDKAWSPLGVIGF